MSYYAYDKAGYLGDVASIGGWVDLVREAKGFDPALDEFLSEGFTDTPVDVRNALMSLRIYDSEVSGTRDNLAHLMLVSDGVFALSEGYSE